MMIRMMVAVCAALAAINVSAAETAWPTKPLRFIVPFPAGSSTDSAARLLTPKLGAALGQQVIIDNRGGASGNIGVETAARATPDGYTLVLGTASTHAVAASVNSRLAYDPVADFAPISLICSSPYPRHTSGGRREQCRGADCAGARKPGQGQLRIRRQRKPRASRRRTVRDAHRRETQPCAL